MDITTILALVVPFIVVLATVGLLLWILLWVPGVILGKAGFPRIYALPAVLTFPISMIPFALVEWPVHRELARLRMKLGEASTEAIPAVEGHAVDLERRGEWKKAVEVYAELERWAPNPEAAEYYRKSSSRLKARMEAEPVR